MFGREEEREYKDAVGGIQTALLFLPATSSVHFGRNVNVVLLL